jgi:hypothetical protein
MTSGNGAGLSGREPETALPSGEQPVTPELPVESPEFGSSGTRGGPPGSSAGESGDGSGDSGDSGDGADTTAEPDPAPSADLAQGQDAEPPRPSRRKAGVAYRPV